MIFRFSPSNFKLIEEVERTNFGAIQCDGDSSAKEVHLEDLIAENVSLIESRLDEEDGSTLLIIGRQVCTSTGRRMDLVALDSTGQLILIEVKRDAVDVKARKDHAEIQSVRYAASLARLRTVDDLVANLYGPYIQHYCSEDLKNKGGDRTPEEWARKKLLEFMADNNIDQARLNHQQSIVLIGAGFDEDTKSAAAWMAKNGLPIRMIELRPSKFGDTYLMQVEQILPLPQYEDFYVDLVNRGTQSGTKPSSTTPIVRKQRIRLAALLQAKKVNVGDLIYFRGKPDHMAALKNENQCEFEGKTFSVFEWTKLQSGWASVNIYEWVMHEPSKKSLEELRVELEKEMLLGNEAQVTTI